MNKLYKQTTFLLIFLFALVTNVYSQEVQMADNFRGEGKIYVVVAVVLTILIGIFIYLFRLEKKIKKYEDEER